MNKLREAAEMALPLLVAYQDYTGDSRIANKCGEAIEALRQALAQPEQPMSPEHLPRDVATNGVKPMEGGGGGGGSQPKRAWVGLTDDEIDSIFVDYGWCISTLYLRVVRSIEAKLKEKNT